MPQGVDGAVAAPTQSNLRKKWAALDKAKQPTAAIISVPPLRSSQKQARCLCMTPPCPCTQRLLARSAGPSRLAVGEHPAQARSSAYTKLGSATWTSGKLRRPRAVDSCWPPPRRPGKTGQTEAETRCCHASELASASVDQPPQQRSCNPAVFPKRDCHLVGRDLYASLYAQVGRFLNHFTSSFVVSQASHLPGGRGMVAL